MKYLFYTQLGFISDPNWVYMFQKDKNNNYSYHTYPKQYPLLFSVYQNNSYRILSIVQTSNTAV